MKANQMVFEECTDRYTVILLLLRGVEKKENDVPKGDEIMTIIGQFDGRKI